MRRPQGGFSLIELLIVVAIILVISAIAIPSFLRSRIAANETAAVSALRTIKTAQITYAAAYPAVGYAAALATLGPPSSGFASSTTADLIDTVLARGLKSGYGFQSSGALDGCGSPDAQFDTTTQGGIRVSFAIYACPIAQNRTGLRNFCTDDTGVLRQGADTSSVCDVTSSPVVQ